MEYPDIRFGAMVYLERSIGVLKKYGIPFERFDHVGLDCDSTLQFERIRRRFEVQHGCYAYTSFISGRRIALIKFKVPIRIGAYAVEFLELSEQKPDGSQVLGFNHIEILPQDFTIREIAEMATERNLKVLRNEKPHHTTFDIRMDDVVIKLTDRPLIEKIKAEEFV